MNRKRQANKDIRKLARVSDVRLWELAMELGMTDSSLSKRMRKELPPEEKERFIGIIRKLAAERE